MNQSLTKFSKRILAAFVFTVMSVILANAQPTNIVISQIYGAGGNAGAIYNADYVELFNPTASSITMTNWSLQYASATGTSWGVNTFSGTIPSGGYFLIKLSGGATGAAFTADVTITSGALNLATANGKIALCNANIALTTGICPAGTSVVDFVGFGTANCAETTSAPAPSVSNSIFRKNNGCTDTNNNSSDFIAAPASPRNSLSPTASCSAPPAASSSAATSITTTSAQLNGSVNANGASTTVTFNYGLTTAYGTNATATQSPVTGSSATSVSTTVSSLSPNTLYNFRVSATNAGGTTNGSNQTFYTLANTPVAPAVNNPSTATLNVTLGSDGNPAATQYAIRESGSGNYVQANGTLGVTEIWQTAATWGTIAVSGLSASTTYTFDVKARNGASLETAFSPGTSGTTSSATSPSLTVTALLNSFSTVAGTPSFSQNYNVTGANLTANIVITAPASFELTTDTTTTWSGTLSLIPASGNVNATVYVRLSNVTAGTYSGTITHTSTGANSPSVSVSGTVFETEPTVQSALGTSAVSYNSMTVSMTGGNGASRIVVASTSPVSYVPVDGIAPSGVNADFSLATDQGSGNKIVYNGTGSSFNLSGLNGLSTYYLSSFEYNGNGVTKNYLTVNPGTASATTLLAPPTTVGNISVSRMKLDTLVISFTKGNGARRMVILAEGAAVSFVPASGTGYTGVSADFSLAADQGSNNRIVYSDTGSTVTVTGVSRNTFYGLKVIEYNGINSTSTYYIAAGGTGSVTTAGYQSYTTGSTYTQNFNTLPTTGAFPMTGFGTGPYFLSGVPVNAASVTGWQMAGQFNYEAKFGVDAGTGTGGSVYSYGATGNNDRALGFLASGSGLYSGGITFVNSSAVPLYEVTTSFDGEQWRNGGSGGPNQLKVQYQLGGSGILGGTWTDVNSLYFNSVISTTTPGALDGNTNKSTLSGTFTLAGSWMPGQTLTIRFLDMDESGSDDGLAVDNFSFSAAPAVAPTLQDSTITFTSVSTTSLTANWLNGNGSGRIVVMNTSNSFTNPVDGSTYTANNLYAGAGEQIIFNGTSSSVNVTGLTAGTTYYFRVFAYNGAGVATTYNTQTASGNPASQVTTAVFPPTQLAFVNINGGNPVFVNTPFSVTVQSLDASNNPQPVLANTTVDLSVLIGTGFLSGTTTGTITAGTSSVTISGVSYDTPEPGVQLAAAASAGDVLSSATSAAFDVYDVATQLDFTIFPASVVVNTTASMIRVSAFRNDFTVDSYYTGNVTLTVVSGPGSVTGTLTKAAVTGMADFTDLVFSATGTYVLQASSGTLITANLTVNVTAPVAMNELVIPQFFGAKNLSGTNTNRTPVITCISFDNLLPNTAYNLAAGLALTTDAATVLGAGSLWNGIAFSGSSLNNAFTTNATGSSGPVWIAIQPSGNATRFGAGVSHVLRVAVSTATFSGPVNAQFSSTATMTALDISSTAASGATTDDGAFVAGFANSCMGGKFALLFDNSTGSGRPLSVSGVVTSLFVNSNQSTLPSSVDSIWRNLYPAGSFAGVIPTGANNANGVRYVEIRSATNAVVNSVADADGIWPSGANTTNLSRFAVANLTQSDVSLTTMQSVSVSGTNVTCFQGTDGTALATASSLAGGISYSWSSGQNTDAISGLVAGTYTVTAQDANGCSLTGSVSITEPALFTVTASNDGPDCINDSIQLSATGGDTYSWSGPNGFSSNDQNPLLITDNANDAGIYSVVVANAAGCTNTASTVVSLIDCSCTPPVLSVSVTDACNGVNGTVDLTVTGGIPPYNYSWSTGAVTEDVTGLAPGTYTISVTDSVNCNAQLIVTVGNKLPSAITAGGPLTFCIGSSVTLTAPAGDTYLWNTGATTASILADTSGSYSVDVTQGTCTLSSPAVIVTVNTFEFTGALYSENVGAPSGTTAISTYTGFQNTSPVTYSAVSTGTDVRNTTASTTYAGASGGGNFFFGTSGGNLKTLLISGINTQGASNLSLSFGLLRTDVNTHITVEVSDDGVNYTPLTLSAAGNAGTWTLITATGTIPSTSNLRVRFTKNASTQFRLDDIKINGTVTTPSVSASGSLSVCGAGSVNLTANTTGSLVWSTGATTKTIQVTSAGTYSFTATGTNGCNATSGATVFTVNPEPVASAVSGTIICFGGTTDVVIAASGGIGPYTGTGTFNVAAGTHTYIVTDVTGCDDTVNVVVTQPALIQASATEGTISCFGGSTTVTISANGGTAPYSGTGTFTVSAGNYSYTVTDVNNCSVTVSGTIAQPDQLTISSFTPDSGSAGTIVTVYGTGFTNVLQAGFGNIFTSPTVINVVEDVKDNSHPYFGQGSSHGYVLNGIQGPELTFVRGVTYTFNINATGHPLVITTSPAGGAANSGSEISNGVVNNSTMNGTLTFTPDNSTPSVVYYNCGVHEYMGYRINIIDAPAGVSYVVNSATELTLTVPSGISSSPIYLFSDCDTVQSAIDFTVIPSVVQLDLTVFLQGYYLGAGEMTPALMNQGVSTDPDVADSLTVELHEATSPFATVYTASGELATDGTISLIYPAAAAGNSYYIVLVHRNHLQTWSSAPVTFGSVTTFDFSAPASGPRPGGGALNPAGAPVQKQ